jgi:hypothetical protein
MLHHMGETGLTGGLTVAEAAVQLGISPTAVRRRIQLSPVEAVLHQWVGAAPMLGFP